MNISYEYQIANLDVANINGMSDVVVAIHYRVVASGTNVDVRPVHSGVVDLDAPNDNFTEFNSLSKEQVQQWLKAKIDVTVVEQRLKAQLEHISTQPEPVSTTAKLPAWV